MPIPKAAPRFRKWRGNPPDDSYGGKPLIDHHGRCAFAELAILWSLMDDGREGIWVDSYRRKFRTGMMELQPATTAPAPARKIFGRIHERNTFPTGCWDVLAWKGTDVLFCEAKAHGKDAIRETQRRWLEAALGAGHHPDDFLLVEWTWESD